MRNHRCRGGVGGLSKVLACPHCGREFDIGQNEWSQLLLQVRSEAFSEEVAERENLIKREYENRLSALSEQANQEVLAERLSWEAKLADLKSSEKDVRYELEKQVSLLKQEQSLADAKHQEELLGAKQMFDAQLRLKDEQIAYYRDFKAKESTKMVGEDLEQHCLSVFEQSRAMAFPQAYFEKDNDARSGSKGDFIFRDYEDDVEYISIMFEMKNEMDTTAAKHKNADFFKELDKDRREKKCEYAVLVSMLEADSDLYNAGIVDVSHRYDKMYVIRPQFFLPFITILRNAARKNIADKKELERIRKSDMDLAKFEDNLMKFKDQISRNYDLASRQFQTAIDEIDKSISHLTKVKESLLSSERNLRLLNDKTEDLTVKRLAKDAPSVMERIRNQS